MRKYRRLTRADRYQLEQYLSSRKRVKWMADQLGMHRSSIYRELKHGRIRQGVPGGKKKGEYSALESHRRFLSTFHDSRRGCEYRGRKIKGWIEDQIILKLAEAWSPEQISNRMRMDTGVSISTESIYKFILSMKRRGSELHKCLRMYGRRKRRFKRPSRYWEMQHMRRRSIDNRPEKANQRAQIGHWERDLMLGKRNTGAVITAVDRKTRFTLLAKISKTTAEETNQKTEAMIVQSKLGCLSITNDNGHEFGKFWELETAVNAKVYFTHPLCPWERGTVENTIGLVRQFIHKGTDLTGVTDDDLRSLQNQINSRPRRGLGFRTPLEVIRNEKQQLILKKRIALHPPEYYEQFY